MYVTASASGVRIWAPAKVNLYLKVLGRRGDGFHEIETLMCPISLYDLLEFRDEPHGQAIRLRIEFARSQYAGAHAQALPEGAENTIVRAVSALRDRAGLKRGALASSVAHDSHNVIAVGTNDADLCAAVNLVIEAAGGLSVADGPTRRVLPLPVAGLMSTEPCTAVGRDYGELDRLVKACGSKLRAPFMTLSFMALLVIPEIKLSDRGLFDGNRFEFLPLFAS